MRWYDKNKKLAKQIDSLVKINRDKKNSIIEGLLELIRNSNPDILNQFVIPTDIEQWHRRWYDKEPTYWIVLNGLKKAEDELLERVAEYLEKEINSL